MSELEWETNDINGHEESGVYSIYDNGGIWYLDERQDYMGFVAVGQFKSMEEAKEAAENMEKGNG